MDERYDRTQTADIAAAILGGISVSEGATVIGLSGELGAGKTALAQELANMVGVAETVVSPTFVVAKFYEATHPVFDMLVHMDVYRIESIDELAPLGFETLLARPKTLLVIEWPERIKDALPLQMNHYRITHHGDERHITYEKSS